jgi:hypothetical protein
MSMTTSWRFAAALVVTVTAVSGCAGDGGQSSNGAGGTLGSVERQMLAAAIDTVVAMQDSTALCLTMMGGPEGPRPPSRALLGSLQSRRLVVAQADCPVTYESMITPIDSQGRPNRPERPTGYVDPYQLSVARPQFEGVGYAWVHIRQLQGTRGRAFLCTTQSLSGRVWANCRSVDSWTS